MSLMGPFTQMMRSCAMVTREYVTSQSRHGGSERSREVNDTSDDRG